MQKIKLISVIIFIMLFINNLNATDDKYKKLWKEVEDMENKGLPKSALEKTEKIYNLAVTDKNEQQVIKSLIYKMKYNSQLDEKDIVTTIEKTQKLAENSQGVTKSFMQLFLAYEYKLFYNQNSWQIDQRSTTNNFETEEGFEFWDKTKFQEVIIKNALLALDNQLKNEKIEKYETLINDATTFSENLPTLYDFFAHFIIENLFVNNYYRSNSNDKLKDNQLLNNIDYFIEINLSKLNFDKFSYTHNTVLVYQKWLQWRSENPNQKKALIDTDLKRLQFIRNNISTIDNTVVWLKTLENMQKKYENDPEVVKVNNEVANYYKNLSYSYNFEDSTTFIYKNANKKALEILNKSLEKFPKNEFSNNSLSIKNEIERQDFSFQCENVVNINKNFPIRIEYKNIETVYLSVLECSYQDYYKDRYNNDKLRENIKKLNPIIKSQTINLPAADDYNKHFTKFLINPLKTGSYLVVLHTNKDFSGDSYLISYQYVQVADITLISKDISNSGIVAVYNNITGVPIENAVINLFTTEYNYNKSVYELKKYKDFKTDKNGSFKINDSRRWGNYIYEIIVGEQKVYFDANLPYDYNEREKYKNNRISIFTDRAIYRPNQTVQFKAICYSDYNEKFDILKNYKVRVELLDVNWQKVSELELRTNEFGSVSGSFEIPANVLTGNFTIRANDEGSTTIKVEEYKRPNFEIEMKKVEGEFKFNDNITAKGTAKSYSGAVISNAKVSYSVTRNPMYFRWWYWFVRENPLEIINGTTETDDNGEFKIDFKAIVDENQQNNKNLYYNFIVNVSVTDINGETQQSFTSIYVSNISLKISADVSETVVKEDFKAIKINSTNIAGEFVAANIDVKISKLKNLDTPLKSDNLGKVDNYLYSQAEWEQKLAGVEYNNEKNVANYKIEKEVYKKTINTGDNIDNDRIKSDNIAKWESGIYRIELKAKDKFGNTVTESQEFILFSEKDKKMPYTATDFFYCDKNSAQPGETVNLKVGSSYKDVFVEYNLIHKRKIIKTETLKLSNQIIDIQIPIIEDYRGNISFSLNFLREGRIYSFSKDINVEFENKKLKFKDLTIRDLTVQPAQEITGKVMIVNKDDKPEDAELMATLYDASLDVFAKNSWHFWMYPNYYARSVWNNKIAIGSPSQFEKNFHKYTGYYSSEYYPDFNFFGFYYYGGMGGDYRNGGYRMLQKSAVMESAAPMAKMDSKEMEKMSGRDATSVATSVAGVYSESDEVGSVREEIEDKSQLKEDFKFRENFNETAFFYPNLRTESNGEVTFTFTMPDALTRWNFMGLAHTKDLKIGQVSGNITTQKELMVTPNLPRFFRENDKITISVKIDNLSDGDIVGKAKIEIYNPETLENINNKFSITEKNINIKFTVKSKGSTSVSWDLEIPEKWSAVGIKILAESENHIDGEDRILPVLSNKMLVTEAIPLPVRKAGTTNFTFNSLKNNNSTTLRHQNFALEFTANPAWYAVQALPYLMEYPYECNEQTFARFYANTLASHIANSDPKIKRVFEIWKSASIGNEKALLSNLEKNQELKALMLEETPWLLQGKNESERKQKIGILFDLNRMSNENSSALKKLKQNQNGDGGWSWFKGDNQSSWYITQHIVSGFGHLEKLGVKSVRQENSNMVKSAISFIDKQLEKHYSDLKKHCDKDEKCMKEDHLYNMAIHYLYARSFFTDIEIPKSTKEAFDYYIGQCEKYWLSKSYYEKGMIALATHRFGNTKLPQTIVKSLKENAMQNEEMGMYWKLESGYYWYQAPIETQALFIEVFTEVTKDVAAVEEMKVWLLKQKQTQDWKTTKATTEAIYALLLQGTNLLSETDYPIITVGNQSLDVANDPEIKTEAGTGYFKKSWESSEISSDFGNISVTKKQNTVSWGAVYWQYFEQLDKIKIFKETPLKINKKLFVERYNDGKKVIVPIGENNALQIGDKITVRIEIQVDRDMEYVHLKDMRAACFEPVDYISGYRWSAGLGYYQAIKDASMNFFISYLRKGSYVFEYQLIVSQKGEFSNGITTMQCMYAPEFTSHSEGVRVLVE